MKERRRDNKGNAGSRHDGEGMTAFYNFDASLMRLLTSNFIGRR
jgi:hypothetical protein